MRPRKKILIVAEDEQAAGVMRFALRVRGFAVEGCTGEREAVEVLRSWGPEAVILLKFSRPASVLTEEMKRLGIGGLAIGGVAELRVNVQLRVDAPIAEIHEAARILAVRRRGPRKGFRWEFVEGRRRVVAGVAKKPAAREAGCELDAAGKTEAV